MRIPPCRDGSRLPSPRRADGIGVCGSAPGARRALRRPLRQPGGLHRGHLHGCPARHRSASACNSDDECASLSCAGFLNGTLRLRRQRRSSPRCVGRRRDGRATSPGLRRQRAEHGRVRGASCRMHRLRRFATGASAAGRRDRSRGQRRGGRRRRRIAARMRVQRTPPIGDPLIADFTWTPTRQRRCSRSAARSRTHRQSGQRPDGDDHERRAGTSAPTTTGHDDAAVLGRRDLLQRQYPAGIDCIDATDSHGVKFDISGDDRRRRLHGPVRDQRQRAHGRHARSQGLGPARRVRAAGAAARSRRRRATVMMPFFGSGAPIGGNPAIADRPSRG